MTYLNLVRHKDVHISTFLNSKKCFGSLLDIKLVNRKRDNCEYIATWGHIIHASPFPL